MRDDAYCDCGERKDEDDWRCAECEAEYQRQYAYYSRGNWRAALEPPRYLGMTREEMIRAEGED